MYAVGDTQWLMYPVGDGRGEEDLCHVQWGMASGGLPQWGSDTCTQWGMGEERRISAMYAVGDTQWLMYPVGDGRGEEDLCHVPVYMYPVGDEEDLCLQWGTLSG